MAAGFMQTYYSFWILAGNHLLPGPLLHSEWREKTGGVRRPADHGARRASATLLQQRLAVQAAFVQIGAAVV
jgi:hypothetical protein